VSIYTQTGKNSIKNCEQRKLFKFLQKLCINYIYKPVDQLVQGERNKYDNDKADKPDNEIYEEIICAKANKLEQVAAKGQVDRLMNQVKHHACGAERANRTQAEQLFETIVIRN
jgi:hypothetical protein